MSYLDIFGRVLEFLCPIWIFEVAFGDFQSFYGDFVAFSWKNKIPAEDHGGPGRLGAGAKMYRWRLGHETL